VKRKRTRESEREREFRENPCEVIDRERKKRE
jgi:hypothetical protein